MLPSGEGCRASVRVTLAIDPVTPTTLYVGLDLDGVFKSTDAGGSWTAINNGLADLSTLALLVDPVTPTTLYAGFYPRNTGGVSKSTDAGGNWTAINDGLTDRFVHLLLVDPVTPTTLYAVGNTDAFVLR